ncbi:Smr/MutS family protein [Thiorhodovibrio frisius]|uniref:Smr domain-containing protein n=1 Tax=Thiorhodovibrio frisius TaxID=631362 RepID=H8Z3D3_9GAMM|nr:Smr/MutS family protein [Thiorhodovibrio frisius]EIC21841.1 hypothetical protein Thi970DRAFT_02074 [Thiorhodovibrio frisius]WPL21809.1 putative DNA endonuclease SmrA [Thiorhodovibrio frisius]
MKKTVQESDFELFRQAVDDAQPLAIEAPVPYRERPPPIPRPRPPEADETEERRLSEHEIDTPEYLLYAQPGVQHRVLGELQRGRIAVDLELDLHGLTAAHAQATLREFLADCRARRVRCARIIHGKGARSPDRPPVLKRKLNYWLRLRTEVLAFCSAPRHDGGTGALYVLLRNPDKAQRRRRRDGTH